MISISENGVWYEEPLKTLLPLLEEKATSQAADADKYIRTLENLRSIIDHHIVWDIDDRKNLIPATMKADKREQVRMFAAGCLIEQVPVIIGPGKSSAELTAQSSIIAGTVQLLAAFPDAEFYVHKQTLVNVRSDTLFRTIEIV